MLAGYKNWDLENKMRSAQSGAPKKRRGGKSFISYFIYCF